MTLHRATAGRTLSFYSKSLDDIQLCFINKTIKTLLIKTTIFYYKNNEVFLTCHYKMLHVSTSKGHHKAGVLACFPFYIFMPDDDPLVSKLVEFYTGKYCFIESGIRKSSPGP